MGPLVTQVPPPVTALDVPPPPAGATKVPEPVSVIFEPSLALEEAFPPAEAVPVAKSTLIMSHRNFPSLADVRSKSDEVETALEPDGADGRFPLSHASPTPNRATLTRLAAKFCAVIFILPSLSKLQ
jgi:hypothetical protein